MVKKRFGIVTISLASLLAFGSVYSNAMTAVADNGCTWVTKAAKSSVTIRAEHNKSSKKLVEVPSGATLNYEECPAKGWVRASYQGKEGWAYNTSLTRSNSASSTGSVVTSQAQALKLAQKFWQNQGFKVCDYSFLMKDGSDYVFDAWGCSPDANSAVTKVRKDGSVTWG